MIYAAASLWLLVVTLLAWGVLSLWSPLAQPKAIDLFLWPGTALAKFGRIVGLLITGAKVVRGAAPGGSADGGGQTGPEWQPKLPVIGPVIVALGPMLALGGVFYLVVARLGMPVASSLPIDKVSTTVPSTLAAFWDQLRALVTLSEGTLNALFSTGGALWKSALLAYLASALTIRLAPTPGNVRGHVAAVVLLGVAAALAGTIYESLPSVILGAWPLLAFAVGLLLLLLIVSLLVRGVVSSARLILSAD